MENFSSRSLARTPLQHAPRLTILTSHIHTHTHARAHARTHTHNSCYSCQECLLSWGSSEQKTFFSNPTSCEDQPSSFWVFPFFSVPFLLPFLCPNAQGCPVTLVLDLKGMHWTFKTSIRPERSVLDLIHFQVSRLIRLPCSDFLSLFKALSWSFSGGPSLASS